MKRPQLRGLIVSVVTPFADDFSVSYEALHRHVDWLVSQGVHGLLIGATAGEYASLSDDERLEIARRAVALRYCPARPALEHASQLVLRQFYISPMGAYARRNMTKQSFHQVTHVTFEVSPAQT